MGKATWVNVGGTWKQVKNIWENVGGVWKQKVIPKINVAGVWKDCIQYYLPKFFQYVSYNGDLIARKFTIDNNTLTINYDSKNTAPLNSMTIFGWDINPATNRVYVVESIYASNFRLNEIDGDTGQIIKYISIPLDYEFKGIVVDPVHNYVYVLGNLKDNTYGRLIRVSLPNLDNIVDSGASIFLQNLSGILDDGRVVITGTLSDVTRMYYITNGNSFAYTGGLHPVQLSTDSLYYYGTISNVLYKVRISDGVTVGSITGLSNSNRPFVQDQSGNLYILSDNILKKYDANLNLIWQKTLDGTNGTPNLVSISTGSSIAVDKLGGIYIYGGSSYKGNIYRFKNDGTYIDYYNMATYGIAEMWNILFTDCGKLPQCKNYWN